MKNVSMKKKRNKMYEESKIVDLVLKKNEGQMLLINWLINSHFEKASQENLLLANHVT